MVFQGRGDHPEVDEMDSILTLAFLNMCSRWHVNDQVEILRLSCSSPHSLFFQEITAPVKGFRTNVCMCVTGQIFHREADSFPDCPESVGEREQSWELQASALCLSWLQHLIQNRDEHDTLVGCNDLEYFGGNSFTNYSQYPFSSSHPGLGESFECESGL